MITRIREARRARKMTLQDVADHCDPPTTPQTIGRLETGTRSVSVAWLNRIARALGVEAGELIDLPDHEHIEIAAILDHEGVHAPRNVSIVIPPQPGTGLVAMSVEAGSGDYRRGDEIWLNRLAPEAFGQAMNRDILLPRPAGRFLFGRLIGREEGKLHILALGAGQRQMVVADPPWVAVAVRLIRSL